MELDSEGLPRIQPVFEAMRAGYTNELYVEASKRILRDLLPYAYFAEAVSDPELLDDQVQKLKQLLPVVKRTPFSNPPCDLSFFFLSQHRSNAFKFFFEIISRWLIPGERLNVLTFFATDITMPDLGDEVYTIVEVVVRVPTLEAMQKIRRNWPATETELTIGLKSAYHAQRILEVKGLSADEKTSLIQEHIAYLMKRRPQDFAVDLISEMQHVLVTCRDEFKAARSYRHLSRIIAFQYLFRKALKEAIKAMPQRRHLSLKLIRTRIKDNGENKPVWGVLVALNFIRDHEVLEQEHLLNAICNYVPNVSAVSGSFFTHSGYGGSKLCTLYVEIEKTDGNDFSSEEITRLRRELPTDLKDRIQHLLHPIFMPQNEEEIMRNMLALAGQIRYLRDIPQVMISFDEQTDHEVSFLVILVRLLKDNQPSIAGLFQGSSFGSQFTHDRSKMVGYLRKKYPKEASVFRLRLPKIDFLRRDHSVDLQKARTVVGQAIEQVLGPFRDYNGGMISKQNELFCTVHNMLADVGRANEFLLENFFYSLTPVVARSVLEPEALKKLFLMLVSSLEESFFQTDSNCIKVNEEPDRLYIMIRLDDPKVKDELAEAIEHLELSSMDLARTFVTVNDTPYLGYIYSCEDPYQRQELRAAVDSYVNLSNASC